ncbi:MAG: peptidylprolyl isomerase [Gemmatimonadaceae bacterium]
MPDVLRWSPPARVRRYSRQRSAYFLVVAVLSLTQCARSARLTNPDAVLSAAAPASFRARFETSQGPFTVEVTRAWAPIGADRFYNLVRARFFDRQKFFRVRARFIAQFGLHPEPNVIMAWKGRIMPDDSAHTSNKRGTLAYAMLTTPNTRGTQIYINLADNSAQLDPQGFAPFGRILEGIEVIDKLYAEYDERAGGGMRAGNQGPIEREGNAWFERNFPKLDSILTVRLVR